jgi:hypothetical protein
LNRLIAPIIALTVTLTLTTNTKAQDAPQSYIGAGVGVGKSTSDFDPKPIEFFVVGQKELGRFRLRAIAGIRTQPQLPALFQEGMAGYKQDGYEIFARPEVDFVLLPLVRFNVIVGAGADYFRQSFPKEPGGKRAHYHSGLNPLGTVGVTFKALGGSHRVAASRIFQEFKVREFDYVSAYKSGGRLIHLRHKGTLNPSYLEGWRARYEYVRPVSKRFSLYFAGEGSYYKYKNFPTRTFGDSYYQRDGVLSFQVGGVF